MKTIIRTMVIAVLTAFVAVSASALEITIYSVQKSEADGTSLMLKAADGLVISEIACDTNPRLILLDGDTNPEFLFASLTACRAQQNALLTSFSKNPSAVFQLSIDLEQSKFVSLQRLTP